MNRKLKFKAWDSNKKEFVFEEFHIIGETTVFNLIQQYRLEEFNDLFVIQFTGLKDKNGKEIYEGDILECPMPDFNDPLCPFDKDKKYEHDWWERGIVKYYNEYARFGLEYHSPFGGEGYTGLEEHISQSVNRGWWVIGNIFENSDLICKNFADKDWQSYSEKFPAEKDDIII